MGNDHYYCIDLFFHDNSTTCIHDVNMEELWEHIEKHGFEGALAYGRPAEAKQQIWTIINLENINYIEAIQKADECEACTRPPFDSSKFM